MRLNNNKILITGGAAGIGKAITKAFLKFDNEVIVIGRNESKLNSFAKSDSRIIPFRCDLTLREDLDALTHFIEQKHPDCNILINNAGIQYNYRFGDEQQVLPKIEKEITANFLAPLQLIGLLLPTIQINDNAAIVNVSSGLGLVPKMQAPVYCGTKAGLHIFTKALRYQLEEVKVFEIIPPLVDTAMTEGRGKGKISPQQLANEFMHAFEKDKFEVNIGKVKLLKLVNRLSPSIADGIMKGA